MSTPDPKYEGFRQIALYTSIPMTLMAGPIIGYFIGEFLDKFFATDPWLMSLFVLMGAISSIRQTLILLKRSTGGS